MYKNKMPYIMKTIPISPKCDRYERLTVEHVLLTCDSVNHEISNNGIGASTSPTTTTE